MRNVCGYLILVFCAFVFSSCSTETVKLNIKMTGSGFDKATGWSVRCSTPVDTDTYDAPLEIKSLRAGRANMFASVEIPKDQLVYCQVSGEGLKNLPYIPIYNNNQKTNIFKLSQDAKIRVRVSRRALKIGGESYEHVKFLKSDHITVKGLTPDFRHAMRNAASKSDEG